MKTKYNNFSRRKTPWDNKEELTPLEDFIKSKYLDSFRHKHPKLTETDEANLLNTFEITKCRCCESEKIVKRGFTKNGLQRYFCNACKKSFTITTNTIFEDHKISITEWIEYCLDIFNYLSLNATSKTNKNSVTTTKYWLKKLFLVISEIQEEIVLEGTVQIDETFYPVVQSDRTIKDGKMLRGLSKDQFCIAVGYDGKHVFASVEGMGKPSQKKAWDTYGNHIKEESLLIHDKEKSHIILVKKLKLKEEIYDSNEIKKLEDKNNPLNEINQICNRLKQFLNAHSGFDRENLQDYINLFCFIYNPPKTNLEKVEKLLSSAIHVTKSLKFRDCFRIK